MLAIFHLFFLSLFILGQPTFHCCFVYNNMKMCEKKILIVQHQLNEFFTKNRHEATFKVVRKFIKFYFFLCCQSRQHLNQSTNKNTNKMYETRKTKQNQNRKAFCNFKTGVIILFTEFIINNRRES